MPQTARQSWGRAVTLVVLLVVLSACASHTVRLRPVERALEEQTPAKALAALETVHDDPDGLSYLLDKGMLLRMMGHYAESIEAFERAKAVAGALEATSLREQAGSLIVNDRVRAYDGEAFEKVLLHVYEALDYIELGRIDEARVESLQVGLRLQDMPGDEDGYRDDAFARTLSGLIYEALGEWSDAMIAYRKAYRAYEGYERLFGQPLPRQLGPPLLRLGAPLGLGDEGRGYAVRFGLESWPDLDAYRRQGDFIFLLHNGLAPTKHETFIDHFDPASGHTFRIALPAYGPARRAVDHARLRIAGGPVIESEVVEDIDAIARETLAEQLPLITARAVARAIAKWKMAKELREKHGDLAGLFADIAGFVSERADTRGWQTLPADIQMARTSLPAGDYPVTIELIAANGRVLAREQRRVELEAGQQTLLELHWTHAARRDRAADDD